MSTNFVPANELEELLIAAAQDATRRPRFCRILLESELFVIVVNDEKGTRIQTWQRDGEAVVPIFSSLARLQEFAQEAGLQ
ncbi:MAG TPA: SseB family protein, partial [Pyrinomonadaceae bacterium]|nr:SseB family protein [Pyrinomonadaceae bacterium]